MSTSVRQSNLFAAEDYQKVFQAFQFIDYTAYDFDTLKQALINYIQTYYPEDFNDYIESSEFIAIIELLAYLGTSLAFRTDLNSRENFMDTATRRQSILQLAQMINYVPRRNICASGLFKIVGVETDQLLTDANGVNINNVTIFWNDPNNEDWFDQFVQICNAAFSTLNPFGRPTQSGVIGSIPTDLYQLNSVLNLNVTYPTTCVINGQTYPIDICNPNFITNQTIFERNPDPANPFNFIYRNDSLGVGSANTGFFLYFKQGSLTNVDTNFNFPVPSQLFPIDIQNINSTDVYAQQTDAAGNVLTQWVMVPQLSGQNIIYNSIQNSVRNIFSVITGLNDTITVSFADGNFGNVPTGLFRFWVRVSANQALVIQPSAVQNQTITIPYIGTDQQQYNLTLTFTLEQTIGNAAASETNEQVQLRAPEVFSTQDRMVNGSDYNILPLIYGNQIAKLQAIDRTYSGMSRYIDLNDPTGFHRDLIIFGQDGALYRDNQDVTEQIIEDASNSGTIETILIDAIEEMLTDPKVTSFYLDAYLTQFESVIRVDPPNTGRSLLDLVPGFIPITSISGNGTVVTVNYVGPQLPLGIPIIISGVTGTPAYNGTYTTIGTPAFVALEQFSSTGIVSNNGVSWTPTSLPLSTSWIDICFGTQFVGISNAGYAIISSDGINWSEYPMPPGHDWTNIAYGSGTYVAIAASSFFAAISIDGINWTTIVLPTLPVGNAWNDIAYGGGIFCIVNQGSGSNMYSSYSPDGGHTWSSLITTAVSSSGSWNIASNGTEFVVVGNNGAHALLGSGSSSWSLETLAVNNWRSVAYGGGLYMAVPTLSQDVATSPNGITWTIHAGVIPEADDWWDIAYSNGTWAITGGGGASLFVYSTNGGISWANATVPTGNWYCIAAGLIPFPAGTTEYTSSTVGTGITSNAIIYGPSIDPSLPLFWKTSPMLFKNDTGYFANSTASNAPAVTLTNNGNLTPNNVVGSIYQPWGFIQSGCVLQLAPNPINLTPLNTVSVNNVVQLGLPTIVNPQNPYANIGPVALSLEEQNNYQAIKVYPPFRNALTATEIANVTTAIENGISFYMYYDLLHDTWGTSTAFTPGLTDQSQQPFIYPPGIPSSTPGINEIYSNWTLSSSSGLLYVNIANDNQTGVTTYNLTARGRVYIFQSLKSVQFYWEPGEVIIDNATGLALQDTIEVMPFVNTNSSIDNNEPDIINPITAFLPNEITFNISGVVTQDDGYVDPSFVQVSLIDTNADGIPDDPEGFDDIVSPMDRIVFEYYINQVTGYQSSQPWVTNWNTNLENIAGNLYVYFPVNPLDNTTLYSAPYIADQILTGAAILNPASVIGLNFAYMDSANLFFINNIAQVTFDPINANTPSIPNQVSAFFNNTGTFPWMTGGGPITEFGVPVPGSGYVTGVHNNGGLGVPLIGGTGIGATANITVTGGQVTIVALNNPGNGYSDGDILTASNVYLGGVGGGFSVTVIAVEGNNTNYIAGKSGILSTYFFDSSFLISSISPPGFGVYYILELSTTTNLLTYPTGTIVIGATDPNHFDKNGKVFTQNTSVPTNQQLPFYFKWSHYAPIDQVVDPSATNIIDMIVITDSFYQSMLNWAAAGGTLLTMPEAPTTEDLRVQFQDLDQYKMISDNMIWNSGSFLLLFGPQAFPQLQANFVVVPAMNTTVSNNEIRTQVIAATNAYFDIRNWDFGETFYFSELAAFIHQQLITIISTIVIVPTNSGSQFGNLFEIVCGPTQLFLSTATVDNVQIVSTLTNQNLNIQ